MYPLTSFCLVFASLATAIIGTSCSTTPPPPAADSYWNGDSMNGSPSVRIDLSDQRAYFYKGGALAGVSRISSGREGRNTVTGSFHIIQKDADHESSLFGSYIGADGAVISEDVDTTKDTMPEGAHYSGAKMPYFMRIVDGTGMHEGYLPGYPASHGCIRMPREMAAVFFRNVSVGTPVVIEP